MNALLSKFENVVIKNDTRISEVDRAYCEKQEKMYKEAIQVMQQTLELFKELYGTYSVTEKSNYRGYIEEFKDIRNIEDRINDFKSKFISNIFSHFERSYNVTLNSSEIRKKYDLSITYQNIIDEVFEQLGGFNFQEKAVKEIKDASRDTVYRGDKLTIKKGKLSIQDYVWWSSYSWDNEKKLSYNDSKVRPLFKALSHFETGVVETLSYYNNIYDELYKGDKTYDIFSKYELGYNKVKSIKFYKNGKVDIEFQTQQQAEEFKREYLSN